MVAGLEYKLPQSDEVILLETYLVNKKEKVYLYVVYIEPRYIIDTNIQIRKQKLFYNGFYYKSFSNNVTYATTNKSSICMSDNWLFSFDTLIALKNNGIVDYNSPLFEGVDNLLYTVTTSGKILRINKSSFNISECGSLNNLHPCIHLGASQSNNAIFFGGYTGPNNKIAQVWGSFDFGANWKQIFYDTLPVNKTQTYHVHYVNYDRNNDVV